MENRVKAIDQKAHNMYRNIFETAEQVTKMYHGLPEKKHVQSGQVPQGQGNEPDHKEACMSVLGGLMNIGKGFAEFFQALPI